MGRPGAFFADEAHDVLPVELHREPGADLLGHHDGRLGDPLPHLVRAAVHEMLDHADRHAGEIGQAIFELRAPGRRPRVTHLQRLELERLLGGEVVLADQVFDAGQELLILEHQDLEVEDARFVHTSAVLGLGLELLDVALDVAHRRAQAADFLLDLRARHDAVGDLGQRPADDDRRTDGHPGRDPDALQPAFAHCGSCCSSCSSSFMSAPRCIS